MKSKTKPDKIEFETSISERDGIHVIHIDTPGIKDGITGPLVRIYLNDCSIYENPKYPKD